MHSRRRWIVGAGLLAGTTVAALPLDAQSPPDSQSAAPLRATVPVAPGPRPRLELGTAIGTITADSVVPTAPVFQFTDLLEARLAGVEVQSGGGQSGSGASIVIRGAGTLSAGSNPVVYLDGVRVSGNPATFSRAAYDLFDQAPSGALASGRLEDLSPNEIERVDILSGPASTTAYGPEAANGVVLVTTRSPGPGAVHWGAFAEAGALSAPAAPTYDSYLAFGHTTGPTPIPTDCPLAAQVFGVCVQDSLTHFSPLGSNVTSPIANGRRDQYGLQVGGGAGAGRFFLSGEQQHETGVLEMPAPDAALYTAQDGHTPYDGQLRPNAFDRTNLRGTLGVDLGSRGTLSVFGNAIDGDHRSIDDEALALDAGAGSGSRQLNDGWLDTFFRPRTLFANDVTDRVERYIYGANASWRPWSGISAQAAVGADHANAHEEGVDRTADNGPVFPPGAVAFSRTDHSATEEYSGSVSVTGQYGRIGGVSSQSTVGVQYREQKAKEYWVSSVVIPGMPFPLPQEFESVNSSLDAIQRGAFIEEVVGWRGRLFVTGALGVDGPHGLLGKESYGYPRAAVSWVASEHGADVVRLRGAYGQSVNIAGIRAVVSGVGVCELPGGDFGVCPESPQQTLPERTSEFEAGVDASMLGQRVTVTASVYQRTTDHAIMMLGLAPSVGGVTTGPSDGVLSLNSASIRNRGVELSVGLGVVRGCSFSWDVDLVGWANQNRVMTLGPNVGPLLLDLVYRVAPGLPTYAIYEPTLTYHDLNHDGIIEPNEVTQSAPTNQGSSAPTRSLALHNGVTLLGGRLRVAALLDYRGGDKQIDNVLSFQNQFEVSRATNDPRSSLAAQAEAVAANSGTYNYLGPAEDASFVRLRELSITLAASPGIARALRTSSASISLLARNLWLWTPYGGTDPEINVNGNTAPAISTTVVPQPRYFVLRVNLGF